MRVCHSRKSTDCRTPAYDGAIRLAVTACLKERRQAFRDAGIVEKCVEILSAEAETQNCKVPIYCFMPDHFHMIVEGVGETRRPKLVADRFKLKTSIALQAQPGRPSWQKSYFDHKIRASDDWRRQAIYIFVNPIRAGLAIDPFEYPFTGSIGYDLGEVFEGLTTG